MGDIKVIGLLRDFLNQLHEVLGIILFIDIWTVFFLAIKSLLLAFLLSKIYKVSHDKYSSYFSNARSFFIFIFSFSMTLLLINKNILGAFSLIGAISIIRFRAVMKNPLDTGFFYLSLVAGASLSVHMMWEVMISFGFLYIIFKNFHRFETRELKRVFCRLENFNDEEFQKLSHAIGSEIVLNIKSKKTVNHKYSYLVEFRSPNKLSKEEIERYIGKTEGVCVLS